MKLIALLLLLLCTAHASAMEATTSPNTNANTGSQAKIINNFVSEQAEKIKVCHAKQSFYNPNGAGADADGCVATVTLPSCTAQQVLTSNGTSLSCVQVLPTCPAGRIIVSTGSGWQCG